MGSADLFCWHPDEGGCVAIRSEITAFKLNRVWAARLKRIACTGWTAGPHPSRGDCRPSQRIKVALATSHFAQSCCQVLTGLAKPSPQSEEEVAASRRVAPSLPTPSR